MFKFAPGWFWLTLLVGAAIRLYLVVWTEGTTDVQLWESHARDVIDRGLIGYYHVNASANHPPFISEVESLLMRLTNATGLPFRILLRAPFALLDVGSAFLVLLLFPNQRWRFIAAAGYWLCPVALIFSAYHGNTDSAVAFFLLLSVWLLSKERLISAAAALGISFWIKLPGIVAVPALVLFVQGWRRRAIFLAVTAFACLVGYLPVLVRDAPIVYSHVFGYRAQNLHTVAGISVWGPRVLLFSFLAPEKWPMALRGPILFFLEHSWQLALALALLLASLRRSGHLVGELCATVAMTYFIIYSVNDGFSFQYLAWSLPFWFFLPVWISLPAIGLASAYIYGVYWYLCGNPRLRGQWDFAAHPYWPPSIIALRNLTVWFFFAAAVGALVWTIWRRFARPVQSAATTGARA